MAHYQPIAAYLAQENNALHVKLQEEQQKSATLQSSVSNLQHQLDAAHAEIGLTQHEIALRERDYGELMRTYMQLRARVRSLSHAGLARQFPASFARALVEAADDDFDPQEMEMIDILDEEQVPDDDIIHPTGL